MTFSTIISKENDITIPTPTLSTEPRPVAMAPTIAHNMMEITIGHDTTVEIEDRICNITLSKNNNNLYYYCQNNTTLYDSLKSPLWRLVRKDWHGMTLSYRHIQSILSTEEYNFTFNSQLYQWKLTQAKEDSYYTLNCYSNQQLVAQLNEIKFKIEIPNETTNPFKVNDNPLVTFIILSGLIINDHVKNLLKSLGNDPEAIKTILYFNKSHNNQAEYNENDEDEDVGSLSYNYHQHHYPGHRSLVENEDRWSSAHSFKSIELNPGVWHWWHKVWWSCFPCCMPGGCCDRVCIKLKGHNSRSNSRPLSRKGWQQQY